MRREGTATACNLLSGEANVLELAVDPSKDTSIGEECDLRELPDMMSAKFLDYLTPSALVRILI